MFCLSFLMQRLFAVCALSATLILGVSSAPLALITTIGSAQSFEHRPGDRYRNLPIRLMRKTETGTIVEKPHVKVSPDEDWAIFIGTTGFQALPGSSGTLTAVRVEAPRDLGGRLRKLQNLGNATAHFSTPEQKINVFDSLLTDVPALHEGNSVSKTNLAYLNGIFAYLVCMKVISTGKLPQEWIEMHDEMLAVKGGAL
ncbi:hypothetical protein J3R30DRAFT_3468795 [Lentinula aciculospora]|uniref:Uncharacterized protein n=1 Tax=Lentinula aciculospora TaxID=153920 RepID=A0A9W9AEG8_9AGAR|nr:hypothetical protein J3R30DRAFT_3468795 [Lentinula aciculospora]